MERFQVYKSLAWLNALPEAEARRVLLDCCGSREWAARMASERPFRMLEHLYGSAEKIWKSLTPADWLEAFAAHPQIGATPSGNGTRSSAWSVREQSGTATATDVTKRELAQVNRLYKEKFGFIFIVCASGLSAEEMVGICRSRLGNTLSRELEIAAREQQKITELRLNKLLQNECHYDTRA